MAATNAARLRAAAEAAAQRVGYISATPGPDQHERQNVHLSSRMARARVIVELDLQHESRARTTTRRAPVHNGPNPLFLAQYLAQETANADGDAVVRSRAAAHYPSLGFEQDILLPGDAGVFVGDAPRVDIYV